MAYVPIPTKGLGDILPADDWNQLATNNADGPIGLAAAAGDLFQATGANAMEVVSIGAAGAIVRANSTPDGIEYDPPLGTTPTNLNNSSNDDKIVLWQHVRQTFLPVGGAYREYDSAGSHSLTWPWNTATGLAIIIGGKGGDGGGGGGGGGGSNLSSPGDGGSGGPGEDGDDGLLVGGGGGEEGGTGGDGGNSSVASGGTTHTADGGDGGRGGGGGGGGARTGLNPDTSHGGDGGGDITGGAGGRNADGGFGYGGLG